MGNNHVEWSNERLTDRLSELHVNYELIPYSGERLAQVEHEMALIAFEMSERYRETKEEEIEQAWADKGQ